MDALITYLPFYRVHEILDYFIKNAELMSTNRKIVYIDNVYTDRQLDLLKKIVPEDIEIRHGNWRDRNMTFMRILRDAKEEGLDALVVDSDNVLDGRLARFDRELVKRFGFYTVIDYARAKMKGWWDRSVKLGSIKIDSEEIEVYGFRVFNLWKTVFFIGPKQAVRLSKDLLESLNYSMLENIEESLKNIDARIKSYLTDETVLGMLLFYSNIRTTPWVIMSYHVHHGSTETKGISRTSKLMVAMVHTQLGKELLKRKLSKEMLWYYTRYKIAQLYNFLVEYIKQ